MSQLGKFTITFIVLILVLEFAGIPTAASSVLSDFGITLNDNSDILTADLESSSFFSYIFGSNLGILLTISTVGAAIIGFFARSYDTSLVVLPLIVFLGGLLAGTSWSVISYVNLIGASWLTKIVSIIFIGLGVGFIWACVDNFRTGT